MSACVNSIKPETLTSNNSSPQHSNSSQIPCHSKKERPKKSSRKMCQRWSKPAILKNKPSLPLIAKNGQARRRKVRNSMKKKNPFTHPQPKYTTDNLKKANDAVMRQKNNRR